MNLNEITAKTPLVASAPCRRCGSPIKIVVGDDDGNVTRVDYLCGSTLRLAPNKMWEFDALCRHTENQPRPKPIAHIGSSKLSSVPKEQVEKLEADGYAVVITQFDGGVRILTPEPAMASADEIGMAALEAMQGPTNDSVRAKFAEILFRKLQARDGGAK
jgi:hypothetical protein